MSSSSSRFQNASFLSYLVPWSRGCSCSKCSYSYSKNVLLQCNWNPVNMISYAKYRIITNLFCIEYFIKPIRLYCNCKLKRNLKIKYWNFCKMSKIEVSSLWNWGHDFCGVVCSNITLFISHCPEILAGIRTK